MRGCKLCGLVGIAGSIEVSHETFFKNLLKLDTVRGPDSTGILRVGIGGETNVLKDIGTPYDLAQLKKYDELFRGYHKLLLGHNRSATKGSITRANSHPFEFSDVIGAHNGTLRSVYDLKDGNTFDVDSEALFNDLNINGVDVTIPKINGAFALTWYSKSQQVLSIIRNSERPLYFNLFNGGKTIAWASEGWMLTVAAGMSNVKLEGDNVSLKIGELVEIDLEPYKNSNTSSHPKLYITQRSIELRKETYSNYGYNQGKTLPRSGKNGTGATSNIVPMSRSVDKDVIFEVVGCGKSISNQDYIVARISEVEGEALSDLLTKSARIFPRVNSKDWNEFLGSTNYFYGKIKHYNSTDGGYYTIQLSSVIEITEGEVIDSEDKDELYVGYNNTIITKDELLRNGKNGCSNCSSSIDPMDDNMVWTAETEFTCGKCISILSGEGCI